MCDYVSDKSCPDFNLKMHQSVWLRPDPLERLQSSPDLLAGFKGWSTDKGRRIDGKKE